MLLRCVLCNNGSYPHAVCLFSESYVLHLFQTDASFLPRTLATNPTRSAAMIVPSHTIEMSGKYKRQDCCDHCHGNVKADFCRTKVGSPCQNDCSDKRFSRQHYNVCQHFHVHTKSKDQTPNQKIYDFHNVCLWIYPCKQKHGQIDEISKDNGYRYLQNMFQFKIFTQDQQLQ